MAWVRGLLMLALLACASPVADAQQTGRRVALVIGNSAYVAQGTLANPGPDSRLVADALRRVGFAVTALNCARLFCFSTDLAHFQIGFPSPGNPSVAHFSVTRAMTSPSILICWPHSRFVSGGHLFVASSAILPPSPDSGLAKSR